MQHRNERETVSSDAIHFRDAEGVVWRVYERPHGTLDRRSGQSLVFESDGKIRRVRGYPADWRLLPPAELEALSWRR